MAPEVVGATALLAVADSAAAIMPQQRGGTGLALLATSLRECLERGDGPTTRDGLLTAAGVAKGSVAAARGVISAGIASTAELFLQDAVSDAAPDVLASAFLLLAHCVAAEAPLAASLLASGLFDHIRVALQMHCGDAYSPQEPLLYAISLLLRNIAPHMSAGSADALEELRGTMRRVLKAAAGSTGYIDAPRTAAAILDLISVTCAEDATAREAVRGAEGEEFIVQVRRWQR